MRHFLNGTTLRCDCLKCNRTAQEEEEKEKKVDDIANEEKPKEKTIDKKAKAQELEKRLQEIQESLKKSGNTDHDEELEDLMAEIHDLLDKLNNSDDDDDEEVKKSRSGSLETLGVEPLHNTINGDNFLTDRTPRKSIYNVLTLKDSESVSGDSLLIRMGSTDDHTVGNSEGDKFLKMLGSRD